MAGDAALACNGSAALLALAWTGAAAATAATPNTPNTPIKPATANAATERIGFMARLFLAVIGEHGRMYPRSRAHAVFSGLQRVVGNYGL